MRVAIIGTGISGSLAARLLATEHEVTVYEASGYPGGHANTVDVSLQGQELPGRHGVHGLQPADLPELLQAAGVAERPFAAERHELQRALLPFGPGVSEQLAEWLVRTAIQCPASELPGHASRHPEILPTGHPGRSFRRTERRADRWAVPQSVWCWEVFRSSLPYPHGGRHLVGEAGSDTRFPCRLHDRFLREPRPDAAWRTAPMEDDRRRFAPVRIRAALADCG